MPRRTIHTVTSAVASVCQGLPTVLTPFLNAYDARDSSNFMQKAPMGLKVLKYWEESGVRVSFI